MSTELGSHTALAVADSDVGIILEHKGTAEQMHKPQGSFGAFGMPVTVQASTVVFSNCQPVTDRTGAAELLYSSGKALQHK